MSVITNTYTVTAFTFEDNGKTRVFMEPNLTSEEIYDIEGWLELNNVDKFRTHQFRRALCETLYNMDNDHCWVSELKDMAAINLEPLPRTMASGDMDLAEHREAYDYTFDAVAKNLANRGMIKFHDSVQRDDDELVELTRVGKIILGLAYK